MPADQMTETTPLFKENLCPKCKSPLFYRRTVSKYCYREYCLKCNHWKRNFTERVDKKEVPSHCGKCKYFSETVFEGETANGWGSWDGQCLNSSLSGTYETKSRYYGCDLGELRQKEVKQ